MKRQLERIPDQGKVAGVCAGIAAYLESDVALVRAAWVLLSLVPGALVGGLLAYVGFGQRDEGLARNVVGGLGAVYLLVGLLGFVVPMLLGLIPHGFSVVDNIIHLALGVAGLAVAFSSRGGAPASGWSRECDGQVLRRAAADARRSRLLT